VQSSEISVDASRVAENSNRRKTTKEYCRVNLGQRIKPASKSLYLTDSFITSHSLCPPSSPKFEISTYSKIYVNNLKPSLPLMYFVVHQHNSLHALTLVTSHLPFSSQAFIKFDIFYLVQCEIFFWFSTFSVRHIAKMFEGQRFYVCTFTHCLQARRKSTDLRREEKHVRSLSHLRLFQALGQWRRLGDEWDLGGKKECFTNQISCWYQTGKLP